MTVAACLVVAIGLSACARAPAPQGIYDPFEKQNRAVHGVNLALDKNVIRPLAVGAGKIIPKPVSRGIGNFANNLGLPSDVINDILQVKFDQAAHNTVRFAINSTIGVLGL